MARSFCLLVEMLPEYHKSTWRGIVDTRNAYKRQKRKRKSGSGASAVDMLQKWVLSGATESLDKYNKPPQYVYFTDKLHRPTFEYYYGLVLGLLPL